LFWEKHRQSKTSDPIELHKVKLINEFYMAVIGGHGSYSIQYGLYQQTGENFQKCLL